MGLIEHILRSTINVVSPNNIVCKFVFDMTNLPIWKYVSGVYKLIINFYK